MGGFPSRLKIAIFLAIISFICTMLGESAEIKFFTTIGTIGLCGAGIFFMVWIFEKFFLNKKD